MCWQVVYTLHTHFTEYYPVMVLKIFFTMKWFLCFLKSQSEIKPRVDGGLISLWLFGEMKIEMILQKYFRGSDKLLESTSQSNISVSRCKQCVYILLEYHSQSNILWIVFTVLYQRYVSVILLSTPFLHPRNTCVIDCYYIQDDDTYW